MDAELINEAIVVSMQGSAIPKVDRQKLIEKFGESQGGALYDRVLQINREAGAMPIDWGDMTLAEGTDDIMRRFSAKYPELSPDALTQIGRAVSWGWR